MTTRYQVLRSSTTGNVPAAGARQPGELWTNFPDLQLGVIDASKNAQRLVAVRYFSATANYAAGDFVVQAGVLYAAKGAITAGAFNSTQWARLGSATDPSGPYLALTGGTLTGALILAADPGVALGAATKQYVDGKVTAAPFLPLAGGTLTGLVTLSGPPSAPLHAATKAYVDSGAFVPIAGGTMTGDLILNRDAQVPLGAATLEQVSARGAGDNRIINGDMRIDQRNNGAGVTVNGYSIDRWQIAMSQASKYTAQRTGSAAMTQNGFPYVLTFTSLSAYTPLVPDSFFVSQTIEADMTSDFAWGTAGAQPVTLSFWVNVSAAGTYGGSITNNPTPPTRCYPFSFALPTGWTKVVITIPGDTAGTWVTSGNAGGVALRFDLGSGSQFRAAAGAWVNGNFNGVTGSVSLVSTNAAIMQITGVKLEIGSVATPYNRQSLAKSMADCQRCYSTGQTFMTAYGPAGASIGTHVTFPVTMRANPTIVVNTTGSSNINTTSSGALDARTSYIYTTFATAASATLQATFTASAEL